MFEYILYVKIKVVTIGICDDCKDFMLRNLLYDLYVVSRFLTNKVQKWHTLWQVFYAFVSSEFVGRGWQLAMCYHGCLNCSTIEVVSTKVHS